LQRCLTVLLRRPHIDTRLPGLPRPARCGVAQAGADTAPLGPLGPLGAVAAPCARRLQGDDIERTGGRAGVRENEDSRAFVSTPMSPSLVDRDCQIVHATMCNKGIAPPDDLVHQTGKRVLPSTVVDTLVAPHHVSAPSHLTSILSSLRLPDRPVSASAILLPTSDTPAPSTHPLHHRLSRISKVGPGTQT
jgi:hypothetical protein